jgi:alkyl sulfatase BDS1-like metallo-beta-lactamase superfamily hydrolase
MKKTRQLAACTLLIGVVAACGKTPPAAGGAAVGQASPATVQANEKLAQSSNLADPQSFDDAKHGLIARPSGQVFGADGQPVWDFASFAFIGEPPPPTVNPSLWRQARLNNYTGLFKVTDGIYQLRGFDLANITLIEGRTGWIVVDTLTSRETAEAAMAFARKHLGEHRVTALIFTHSHVDHFGGALGVISAEEVVARKVPVVAPEGFLEEATSENVLMGPSMGRRAMYMYGSRLDRSPAGLVDNGLGKAVSFGSIGVLPPTEIVSHTPQEMTLDGVRFVFQNVPGSEAPAELTFYLPELKAYCGAEMLSQTMHNLYTLRGAKVRDALRWSNYIDEALQHIGDAEVYFGQHHWPVWGHERIVDFLKKHRDVYHFIHDQTVRMANAGFAPEEIAEKIKLPKSLDSFLFLHGYYGTLRHNAKAVYQYYVGWFDGNPAHLDPLPRKEAAKRYIELIGGVDKAVAAAQTAYDHADYRWAAELLNHAVFAQPDNAAAKELLARTYEQLGYVAESGPWRNFYLTGAYELRNGTPKKGVDKAALLDMLKLTPPERFLDAMAASLDAAAAEDKDLKINLVFSDLNQSHVLWIENAVLHHRKGVPAQDANATLTLTRDIFLKMMTGTAGVKDTLLSDQMQINGSKIDLVRFFTLFDKAPGVFAIVTP